MNKILLLLLSTFWLVVPAQAQQQINADYGQPLLILTETNPALSISGADVPTFALYEGGQIIYRQEDQQESRYYLTRLAREQLQEYIGSLLISEDLIQLPLDTAASTAACQPTIEMVLNFDTLLVKRVYGNLRNDSIARANTPSPFLKVYDNLIQFQDNHAQEWLPEKIEVLVSDHEAAAEQVFQWPAEWPTLKSTETVWRSEKLYSLYLDKKYYKELRALMDKLNAYKAVEINGKNFSISYRLPFPNML